MNPMLSVLLPAYNAEKYIEEAIHSILAQTFSDFELLIADDASTDRTKEIIQNITDYRIRCFHNTKNLGKTDTVAELFKHVRGQLITIHDADDVSLPERFAKQVKEFQNNPELGMCGTSFVSINEDGSDILEIVHMKDNYQSVLEDIDNCSQFHGPTMMIKKSILDNLGEIYRPYFGNYHEDTDLAYRITEKCLAYNLPDILYQYRILPTSLCRQIGNVRRRSSLYEVVVFLANERKQNGIDSIAEDKPEVVDAFFEEITHKYRKDPSLIHRENAAYFMYWNLYKRAIGESFLAVKKNPIHAVNVRTLFYCIRKTVLAFPREVVQRVK